MVVLLSPSYERPSTLIVSGGREAEKPRLSIREMEALT
jgi:hypothetical protein